ncbi:hypothetical protein L1F30_13955 [Simiduia sp. 21SJ11W-1]|uniref:hypothetical protein n=1 Tax=Simiduia sp. 21SJ11W-1 TaxID=2909669 RepID=UPI00209DF0E7|nr:hypothetical protein [Simiduia sp. 21SJ11W-1]UTA47261.1 hypothetical protein L1F30_13955 [Simiduia sp. 21SJ11W-1]
MSLESITHNIDTQLKALEQTLHSCEQQLAECDQERQPFLEREIAALKTTRGKLIKSRALAIQAHELRQQAEHPPIAAAGNRWLWRSALILVFALIGALATLTFL